jgi:hypothetical protein
MSDLLNSLPIIGREIWGSNFDRQWPDSPQWPPVYHKPLFLVIHHTVTSNEWNPLQAVQAIWRYHAQTQDWGDIRYHYLIGQDGSIYEGRCRGDKPANIFVEGGQTTISNTHKVGIAMLGQFEPSASKPPPAKPTLAALEALVKLLSAIVYHLELDPLGEAYHSIEEKSYPVISGHRQHTRTTCPGENLIQLIPDIRQQVAAEIERHHKGESSPPPQPPEVNDITLTPTSNQVAWGKSVWPNLLWGDDDLYVGVWGDSVYTSLIEFSLPQALQEKKITRLEITLTGQADDFLKESDGSFRAVLLATPLRGDNITATVPFDTLRQAPAITKFLPLLSAGDLAPGAENRLAIDPLDMAEVNQAAASGYLAVRLEGPKKGRQLFSWDSGYGEGGLLVKPTLILGFK